jgi:hypothetical protein
MEIAASRGGQRREGAEENARGKRSGGQPGAKAARIGLIKLYIPLACGEHLHKSATQV